jgi:hypothetical protein
MSRHLFVVAAIVGSLSSFAATEARAQDRLLSLPDTKLLFMPSDTTVPAVAPKPDDAPVAAAASTNVFEKSHTTRLLPLYASTALLQALDVHSTLQVLGHGGGEGNPLMQGMVSNKPVFIAAKAAIAASTIYAATRIAKRSKIGAIITLVGLNSAYALVVSHNYKLAQQMR